MFDCLATNFKDTAGVREKSKRTTKQPTTASPTFQKVSTQREKEEKKEKTQF